MAPRCTSREERDLKENGGGRELCCMHSQDFADLRRSEEAVFKEPLRVFSGCDDLACVLVLLTVQTLDALEFGCRVFRASLVHSAVVHVDTAAKRVASQLTLLGPSGRLWPAGARLSGGGASKSTCNACAFVMVVETVISAISLSRMESIRDISDKETSTVATMALKRLRSASPLLLLLHEADIAIAGTVAMRQFAGTQIIHGASAALSS